MSKRLALTAALFFLALWCRPGGADAQVLTIGNGSTLTVNGGVLDVNCLDILVKNGGTLDLVSGTLQDKEILTVEAGGVYTNTGGIVINCGEGNSFYVIRNRTGKPMVITLPK